LLNFRCIAAAASRFFHADHYLLVNISDPDREYRRLSAGYLSLLVDWIHSQWRAALR
jgi:hypothetical protein